MLDSAVWTYLILMDGNGSAWDCSSQKPTGAENWILRFGSGWRHLPTVIFHVFGMSVGFSSQKMTTSLFKILDFALGHPL